MNSTNRDNSNRNSLFRLGLSLGCLLLAGTAPAQIIDNRDRNVPPTNIGSRGIKMTSTRSGTIVAAFVQQNRNTFQQRDKLVVTVSTDNGNRWRAKYLDSMGQSIMKEVAVSVSSGFRSDEWIYVAVERVFSDPRTATVARWIEVVSGPLDKAWGYGTGFPQRIQVVSDRNSDVSLLDEPLHLSSTIVPYEDNGTKDYMYCMAYRWLQSGEEIIVHTPLRGAHGRRLGANRIVIAGPNRNALYAGHRFAHPSIASDLNGRAMFLAFEEANKGVVHIAQVDPWSFRRGRDFTKEFTTDPKETRSKPEIAADSGICSLTCLGDRARNSGARQLLYYNKIRAASFQMVSVLHPAATSSAPCMLREGQLYAAAHCLLDNNFSSNEAYTVAFTGRYRQPALSQRVGDNIVFNGTPTLAIGTAANDFGVYAYTTFDEWWSYRAIPVHIDAGN